MALQHQDCNPPMTSPPVSNCDCSTQDKSVTVADETSLLILMFGGFLVDKSQESQPLKPSSNS